MWYFVFHHQPLQQPLVLGESQYVESLLKNGDIQEKDADDHYFTPMNVNPQDYNQQPIPRLPSYTIMLR